MRLILAAAVLLATPALAQTGGWTPAPTPNVGGGDTVLPAARTGSPASTNNSAPFSGIPATSQTANGTASSNVTNGAQAPKLSPE